MNTKKTVKAEESAAKPKPAAAKPLSKPAAVKAPKPLAKAAKPAAKPVKPVDAPKPAEAAAKVAVKAVKKPKLKVVRDSFTMPHSEYLKIAEIKEIGLKAGLQVKKSEVLRAGVIALCAMDEAQLKQALSGLDKIKTGRPNKH